MCAIYVKTYLIDFPDVSNFLKGVVKRHDLIRWNSKTIEENYAKYSKKVAQYFWVLLLLKFKTILKDESLNYGNSLKKQH